jgi:hypothetical protein
MFAADLGKAAHIRNAPGEHTRNTESGDFRSRTQRKPMRTSKDWMIAQILERKTALKIVRFWQYEPDSSDGFAI